MRTRSCWLRIRRPSGANVPASNVNRAREQGTVHPEVRRCHRYESPRFSTSSQPRWTIAGCMASRVAGITAFGTRCRSTGSEPTRMFASVLRETTLLWNGVSDADGNHCPVPGVTAWPNKARLATAMHHPPRQEEMCRNWSTIRSARRRCPEIAPSKTTPLAPDGSAMPVSVCAASTRRSSPRPSGLTYFP